MNEKQSPGLLSKLRRIWAQLWHSTPLSRWQTGARAEAAAARYLKRRGYRILERNLRTRLGEIDIVATDGNWLVVVEVPGKRSPAKSGISSER